MSIVNKCMSGDGGDTHTERSLISDTDFDRQAYHDFTHTYGIAIDCEISALGSIDFDKLNKAYAKSRKYLQQKPYCKTLSWVCRNYAKILLHYYDDNDAAPTYNEKVYTAEEKDRLRLLFADDDSVPF